MTIPPPSPFEAAPGLGWALVGAGGAIAAADRKFTKRLGAAGATEVVGRLLRDLVPPEDHPKLAEIEEAVRAGRTWRGHLAVRTTDSVVGLDVEASPRGDASTSLRVFGVASRTARSSPPIEVTPSTANLPPPSPSTRTVLETAARDFGFEVALVLRVEEGGRTIEVVAAHPDGIAGAAAGVRWSPPDASERAVIESGEPAIEGSLTIHRGDISPLARLPGYGLRSAVRVPLFAAGEVAGLVAAYSTRPDAFTIDDALHLERAVRGLAMPSTPPPSATEAPSTVGTPSLEDPLERLLPLLGNVAHELMATVAHELNNPLAAVAGYAQALRSMPPSEQVRALEIIEREALRAGAAVQRLLTRTHELARLGATHHPPEDGAARPASTPAAPPPATVPTIPPRGAGQRVLIVDDEEAIRLLASQVLVSYGYEPSVAASATEALALLEAGPYDAVISDIRMPGMDGIALYHEVARRWPELAKRVVIMTGDVENEAVATLLRERGLGSLEKPFRLEALLTTLAAAIESER